MLVDRALTFALRADAEVAQSRDDMICLVFDTTSLDSVVHELLPAVPLGLSSNDPRVRRGRLVHLVSLMSSWPAAPSSFAGEVPLSSHATYMDYEQSAFLFYLQTVSQFLDRRPTVPRLPRLV